MIRATVGLNQVTALATYDEIEQLLDKVFTSVKEFPGRYVLTNNLGDLTIPDGIKPNEPARL